MSDEISYFELQAYVGTTKHMGGLEATRTLVERCAIGPGTYVLDVGCGVGATTGYLAQAHGCRVVGIDLRPSMVTQARERAMRAGVTDRMAFCVADVTALPFAEHHFDALLLESVLTFVEDKRQALRECARITQPGGCVGLNEELWLEEPPSALAEQARAIWQTTEILTREGWRRLIDQAGLRDVTVDVCRFDARREATQIRRYGCQEMGRMFYRAAALYLRSAAFRRYVAARRSLPKDLFRYLGYAVWTARA
jgi:SAM-dependent methyltransferase